MKICEYFFHSRVLNTYFWYVY